MNLKFKILDFISKFGSYIFTFSLLFFLQKYTIGYLFNIRKIVIFDVLYLYEVLFTFSSIFIIKNFIKISSPYKKYLSKC